MLCAGVHRTILMGGTEAGDVAYSLISTNELRTESGEEELSVLREFVGT